MKRRIVLFVIFLFLSMALTAFAAEVKNTISRQVGNRIQFTYDLIGDETEGEVEVTFTVGGKSYNASDLHLEGAFGKTPTGKGKILWWNVLQDFPRGLDANVTWKIEAGGKTFVSPTLGAKFVLIPAGTFMMGSSSGFFRVESGRDHDETQHQVTISQPFYLQTTETTQGQWKKIMGNNPSHFKNCGDDCPVEQVSWNDVHEFIKKLNTTEGTDKYRLPTEAQWEYAARAGMTTRFYSGDSDDDLSRAGWYNGNSGLKTHPVAQKIPNAWGLYDMHGNVWEWVQDWKGDYPSGDIIDPAGSPSGSYRVRRGGSWSSVAASCRSANRDDGVPDFRPYHLGIRLLRTR
jgi:formylglycine-generating enzyme required for sulfatase activity